MKFFKFAVLVLVFYFITFSAEESVVDYFMPKIRTSNNNVIFGKTIHVVQDSKNNLIYNLVYL